MLHLVENQLNATLIIKNLICLVNVAKKRKVKRIKENEDG